MLNVIVKDYIDLINKKIFPTKLYLDYKGYMLLCKELERQDIDSLFDLEIVLRKKYIYKFV